MVVNPQGKFGCIWCGASPRTKEHLWPRWFARAVPQASVTSHIFTKVNSELTGSRLDVRHKTQSGNGASRTLKVVCKNCNEGWMKAIEDTAQPVLTPLLLGQRQELSPQAKAAVAEWVALKTFIGQYTLPDKIFLTAEDRAAFFQNRQLHNIWKIWLGHYTGDKGNARFGVTHFKYHSSIDKQLNIPAGDNMMISNFVGGALYISVLSGRHPLLSDFGPKMMASQSLVQIYPAAKNPTYFPPPLSMGDRELIWMMNALNPQIRGPYPIFEA